MEDRNSYVQNNIKKLLKKNGMKYTDLARVSGLSVHTIKKIFRKHYDAEGNQVNYFPSTATLEQIAKAFNVSYDALVVPDIDMLAQDIAIVKDMMKDEMFQVRKSKRDVQNDFHAVMIEKGFNQTATTVDYIQFMGYEVRFVANSSKFDKRLAVENANLEKLRKEYQKTIDKYKTNQIAVRKKLSALKEKEEKTEIEKEQEETLLDECLFYQAELIQLQQNLDSLKNGKKAVNKKVGLEQAIDVLNTLDILNEFQRKRAIRQLDISVAVNEYGDSEEPKIISLMDFYNICTDMENIIKQKLFG